MVLRYLDLLREILSHVGPPKGFLRLKRSLLRNYPQFKLDENHDAVQVFNVLQSSLRIVFNTVNENPPNNLIPPDIASLGPGRAAKIAWDQHQMVSKSFVDDLLRGMQLATYKCGHCSAKTKQFDLYDILSFEVPSKNNWRAGRSPFAYTRKAKKLRLNDCLLALTNYATCSPSFCSTCSTT
jgi:hypothetical protein